MIGYNPKEITELLNAIEKAYKDIKNAMENPWPQLSSTMRAEWVGEDEYANEKTLSNALSDLYVTCADTVKNVVDNIHAVGQAWREFQSKNTIENGVGANLSFIENIDPKQITAGEVKLFTDGDRYTGVNLGLTNGTSSATRVITAIEDYAKEVYDKVKNLYETLDANKAFLGEDQAPKITDYLHNMGKAIAKLTVCIKSVKEAIGKAADAYQKQAQSTSEQVSQLKTDIDTDQAIVG